MTHRKINFQKIKLSRQLSDIVIYTQSRKFTSFEDSSKNSKFYNIRFVFPGFCPSSGSMDEISVVLIWHFSSIDENKCLSFCKEDGANLVNHTASQLIRIYPAGKRVDSSNYNPIVPWANGCQIGKSSYPTWAQCTGHGNPGFQILIHWKYFRFQSHWIIKQHAKKCL